MPAAPRISHANEAEIRRTLRKALLEREDTDSILLEEFWLPGGLRADMVVLNGRLAGYEIKSAKDTLKRLPRQVDVYSSVMDEATAVVDSTHLDEVVRNVPEWWGIWTASMKEPSRVVFTFVRPARVNPAAAPESLVCYLWTEELRTELLARGVDAITRPRKELAALLVLLAAKEIRPLVLRTLKRRAGMPRRWSRGSVR